ncbi:MAG: hypothetical protein HQK51_21130 [Oligoflexia bacterium]|nr:hypothetical protein [Oligoflexia bacterium]
MRYEKITKLTYLFFIANILFWSCLNSSDKFKGRATVKTSSEDEEGNVDPSADSTGAEVKILRPSNQIFINKDFCICKDSKPAMVGNCISYCNGRNTAAKPMLYGNVSVGSEVGLNPDLVTLYGWCTKQINDGLINPVCQLEVYDGTETRYLEVNIPANSNKFTADISTLEKNKTYVITLVETGSTSNARTQSFQIRMTDYSEQNAYSDGLLKLTPVNMYSCVTRSGSTANNNNDYELAYKLYYFYAKANTPPTLPPGNTFIFCHNIDKYGATDDVRFPRLDLQEQIFNLWNDTDSRFYDSDNNTNLDINDYIRDRLLKDHGITVANNMAIFYELRWQNAPPDAAGGGNNTNNNSSSTGSGTNTNNNNAALVRLGYRMEPFLDTVSKLSYCPKQKQYNSNIPILRILKDVIGVDTEGLYMSIREPIRTSDQNGNIIAAPASYILIREGLLKKIWFYYDNEEKAIVPDDDTVSQNTIMFNWPPDIEYPLIKKSTQYTYTVRHPSQMSDQAAASNSNRTSAVPHDKKFGCIPTRGD